MPPIIGPIIRRPHPTPASVVGGIVGGAIGAAPAASSVGGIVGSTIGPTAAVAPVGSVVGSTVSPNQPNVGQVAQLAAHALIQRIQKERQQAQYQAITKNLTPPQQALLRPVIHASKQTGVPASLLMGVLGQESNYGTNTGPSSAGARGVGQFIPSTRNAIIQQYGVDPWADPKQGTLATALYLKQLGVNKDPQKALSAYSGGYSADAYNNPILARAQDFAGLDKIAGVKGLPRDPYTYPFDPGISVGRTDMGIDPSGSGLIRAIGRSRYLGQGGEGWPTEGGSGTGPVYKLLGGPRAGENVYTYEGITPRAGLERGDILHRGEPIASSTGSSFETGWAQGRAAGFQPVAAPHYSEGDVTAEGLDFGRLVSSLGGGGPLPSGGSFVPATGGTAYAGTGGTAGGYAAGGTGGAPGSAARGRVSGLMGRGGSRTPWTAQAPEPGTGPVVPTDAPIADQLAQSSQRRAADLQQTLDLIASLGGG